ncbi:hypothetical protein ABEB36_012596 [Hypothenemus hampei]|uniref:Uncharacterized protein n=1 Tax=Hypothenemus hampei TaxID=57062 RepID=A0ABD1EBX6_HYPHA
MEYPNFLDGIVFIIKICPYHWQYNPIEMVWAYCKTFYNKNIQNLKFMGSEKVLNVWQESLSKITSDRWGNYIQHTEKLIIEDWKKYMGNTDIVNVLPLIIEFENESASDSDTDMSSGDDEESKE